MKSCLVIPCILVLGWTTRSIAQSGNERVSWVLGAQAKGDCNEICARKGYQCSESLGRQASSDGGKVMFDGINCKGRNHWNYGQGFSQCTDPTCCNDGSCQYHCSLPTWPGCKIADGFAFSDHSRICPCTVSPSSLIVDSPTEPEDLIIQDGDCNDYYVKGDGKCKGGWVLKQPDGDCGEGYIPVDDKCWERWMFKLCGVELTLVSDTIHCPELGCHCEGCDTVLYTSGVECLPREDTGLCNGVFVRKNDFCLGQCLDGFVNVNGTCQEQSTTRLCDGEHILQLDTCNGECVDGYVNIDGKCLDTMVLCNGVYIPKRGPTCDGKCSTGLVPVDGTCKDELEYKLCNGVYIENIEVCGGDCGGGYLNHTRKMSRTDCEQNSRICNGLDFKILKYVNDECVCIVVDLELL